MKSYLKLCTEYYDIDKPTAPEDALAFYSRYAEQANGPILEAMCGSGRFLIPLLSRGLDIDGVDASPHMLQACRMHCEKRGLNPTLYEQPLHELNLPRKYALIFITSGSFSLLTRSDEAQKAIKRLFQAMLPGGTLVIESTRPGNQAPEGSPWGGRWVERPDGARILLSWLNSAGDDPRKSHSIGRYELIKDGKLLETEFEDFILCGYDPDEITSLLRDAGFRQIRAYGGYHRLAPADGDTEVIVEGRKIEAPA